MKNKILTLPMVVVALMATTTSMAQKNEFSFAIGGGQSYLDYKINDATKKSKTGFQASIGYTKKINKQWGILTGLELASYRTELTLHNNSTYTSYQVDNEGQGFEYRTTVSGQKEKQSLYTINIPVMLQYVAGESKTQFYGQAGVKIGLPLDGTNRTSAAELTTTGYYPEMNVVLSDLPSHGFGTQTNWEGIGALNTKVSYAAAAEAGVKLNTASSRAIYIGAYLDYGLNDIRKEDKGVSLVTYNESGNVQRQAYSALEIPGMAKDLRLVAYGLRVRIGLSGK
jgi:OmpA-OmpF porin, OOP family